MTKVEERELFLKYLTDIYLQNSDLPFSHDIVYNELVRFCIVDENQYIIDKDSLVGVQVKLSNKYRNNDKVNISCDDYFWKIYNKAGKSECEYLIDMYNSVKLYVAVDSKNLYRISSSIFDFAIKENIVMYGKIANTMRADVLVCRVKDVDDAIKLSNYINGLGYSSKIKPNAFSYSHGNVNVVMDGRFSYNRILAEFICEYLKDKKNNSDLDSVSNNDLAMFIENQINLLRGNNKEYYINLYDIDSNDKYRDFIMVSRIILRQLNNDLNIDTYRDYMEYNDMSLKNLDYIPFESEEVKMKYVIYEMGNYYSTHEVHNRIMKFIETGDYTLFTKQGEKNIRAIMYNNFSQNSALKVIYRIGWKALVNVSKNTYEKNGEKQLFTAIDELFDGKGLISFTNDGYARSRLGLIIPSQLLKSVIVCKLTENGMNINSDSLMQLIMNEINKLEDNKKISRK